MFALTQLQSRSTPSRPPQALEALVPISRPDAGTSATSSAPGEHAAQGTASSRQRSAGARQECLDNLKALRQAAKSNVVARDHLREPEGVRDHVEECVEAVRQLASGPLAAASPPKVGPTIPGRCIAMHRRWHIRGGSRARALPQSLRRSYPLAPRLSPLVKMALRAVYGANYGLVVRFEGPTAGKFNTCVPGVQGSSTSPVYGCEHGGRRRGLR